MIALINHVLASSLGKKGREKKKIRATPRKILCSREDDHIDNHPCRRCRIRSAPECPRGYPSSTKQLPRSGAKLFIQLIRVTPRNTRSDRDEHVLGGFDSQLAHVRRWSVVFAGQWWRRRRR